MPAKKKLTPQQQRDRRSKIMLGVLGVVLLAVLAFQLPKLLGGSGGTSAALPPTTTAATGPAGFAAVPAPSQLASFSRFAAKDPFKPGVKIGGAGPGSTSAATTTSSTPAPKAKHAPPMAFTISQLPREAPVPSGPLVPAAMLTINHKKHVIALGGVFPLQHPVFRVVALTTEALWIQLIGGSLANGQQQLKLRRGHPLTLVNSTLGTRLLLAMVKPTTAPPPPVTTTTTATTTTAATAAAPTTTTSG